MMTKLQKRLASAIAAGSILLNVTGTAFAGTSIVINGNGPDSDNSAAVVLSQTRTVVQSNNADVENKVNAGANTGNNEANKNNAGAVSIDTGDADVDVDVANSVNSNHADLDCCGSQDVDLKIGNNGADTENELDFALKNNTSVFQNNKADVENKVDAWADTGNNTADKNNGADVDLDTGKASVTVDISNTGNTNSARIGGGDQSGSISAWIVGNAADSDNDLDLLIEHATAVAQSNEADIENKVDANANTGHNDADKNNGGYVTMDTGDADVDVLIDNAVNMNWADVDCNCLLSDLWAKIDGNAYNSDNEIEAVLADTLEVFQDNCGGESPTQSVLRSRHHGSDCEVENEVDAWADTGENVAKKNNGELDTDPSIETGDASTDVTVGTSGYSNVFGETPDWDLDLGGVNLNISLDLGALLSGLFN